MRRVFIGFALAGLLALDARGAAPPPKVWTEHAALFVQPVGGERRQLTSGANDQNPVLSPDGRRIAYIHADLPWPRPAPKPVDTLWIYDLATGTNVRAAPPHASTRPGQDFTELHGLAWSPDGRTVYVMAKAWVTSDSIHAVTLASHSRRFLVGGNSVDVIPSGPYRGDLLVSEHRYYKGGGSYDPTFVVTPAGKEVLMVPGSDGADDEAAIAAWLKANR